VYVPEPDVKVWIVGTFRLSAKAGLEDRLKKRSAKCIRFIYRFSVG
jgi:hypothetical protein